MHGGSRDLLVRHRKELNQDLREFLDPALLRDENGNKVFDKKILYPQRSVNLSKTGF